MSRIGKKPVTVPPGVKVSIQDRTVTVQGPKGTLSYTHRPEVRIAWQESEKAITCSIDEKDAALAGARAHWGTTRAQIQNMIDGVTKGYQRSLEVVGVGYTAAVQGKQLRLTVGFAGPVVVDIPDGVKVTVEKQFIRVEGADKQAVGQFAAETRSRKKPEPYNGKGIKYTDETVRRKQGKQFGA